MTKIKSAILYEYSTKIKAMGIYYSILYLCVALIFSIIAISTGATKIGANGLELNSVIFISIIGVLGYKEDFKALIQNGYTRKYIFLSTISMFILLSATMALIDTVISSTIHYFFNNHSTFFGNLYGYGNYILNWLWLTTLYLVFCCLCYLVILIINRVGKMVSLFIGVGLSCVFLISLSLFYYVFSNEFVRNIVLFLMKAMGFMSDGTTNIFYPILSFLVIGAVLIISSYAVIRRTELK